MLKIYFVHSHFVVNLSSKTMSLLTFSFYMLSEHPGIEQRLRQEIYDVVGQTGRPTYDQMREMKYMRAFLNGVYLDVCINQNL